MQTTNASFPFKRNTVKTERYFGLCQYTNEKNEGESREVCSRPRRERPAEDGRGEATGDAWRMRRLAVAQRGRAWIPPGRPPPSPTQHELAG